MTAGDDRELAAWAALAAGWPIELGARWLAAEWARVTPRSALAFGPRAAASWMLLDGREPRRGYLAHDLLLGAGVDDALRDAGWTSGAELARCARLRERCAALGQAPTATIATTACCFPGIVWDATLGAGEAERAVRDVVAQVIALARRQAAAVVAVANVPDDAAFAPLRAALAGLGLIRAASAPDTELPVPAGGLDAYLAAMTTAIRRERRDFLRAIDRIAVEDASRLRAPDLVPLLTAQRGKYGHGDGEAAFRDRLARVSSLGDAVRVLVAEAAGRAVGFTALVRDPDTGRLVPRLFACAPDHAFAYFNLGYYEPVRLAAAWGLSAIALGTTAYRAKLLRGARLRPRSTWLAPLDDGLRDLVADAADYRNELEAARRDALAAVQREPPSTGSAPAPAAPRAPLPRPRSTLASHGAHVTTGDLPPPLPPPLRVVFAPVATGDAVFLDTGARLYLIDCGAGIDYAGAVAALGHRHIAGLVLTHAHADHWLALPEAIQLLAPDAWIARPGTTLAPALMRNQSLFEFYDRPVDIARLIDAWDAIPPRALADIAGQPLWDVNALDSGRDVELAEADWVRVHAACIVPAIRWAGRVGVFGADLAGAQWGHIAAALPSGVDLFQAPNHGSPNGRMARWVLDDHLQPGVVILTDAEPLANDHLDWYSGHGRQAYTLQDRRTISVTLDAAGVSVDVGGLALPLAST